MINKIKNNIIENLSNWSKEEIEEKITEAESIVTLLHDKLKQIDEEKQSSNLQKYLGKYYIDDYENHIEYCRVISIDGASAKLSRFDKYTDIHDWEFYGELKISEAYFLSIDEVPERYIINELTEITQEEYEEAVKERLQEMQDKYLFAKVINGGDIK